MANYHILEYKLRTSDFDSRQKLQPASILDFFQDVAGEHADIIGVGRDSVLSQDLVWVVVKVRFSVLSDVPIYSKVRVRTWPLESNRAIFRREYVIEDENGAECVLGSSEWVLMHVKKRRIVPARDIIKLPDGFLTRTVFPDSFPRIPDASSGNGGLRTVPGASMIDVNGHVNNTKYANLVLDAADLGEDELIEGFCIEYHREITKGAPVTVLIQRTPNSILAKGVSDGGEKMFSAEITLRKPPLM